RKPMGAIDKGVTDPEKLLVGLPLQGFLRMNAGVHAQKRIHRVVFFQALIKIQMGGGDCRQYAIRRKLIGAKSVTRDGRFASVDQKHVAVLAVETEIGQKHVLVIAAQEYPLDSAGLRLQGNQVGSDLGGRRTAVDVIAQEYDGIAAPKGQRLDQVTQLVDAAVDIADHI